MTADEFYAATLINTKWNQANEDHLPCFAHRWTVNDSVCTEKLIREYIRLISFNDRNNIDVYVFSVTERDGVAWEAWKAFAKKFPKFFKVVEGGSIHGKYMCRMYIYTKPAKQRKFHADNIRNFRPR